MHTHSALLQVSMAEAAAWLASTLQTSATELQQYSSGVVRFEVPLPRGTSALRWLRGQQQGQQQQEALPLVYFCSRQSSASDTPGTDEAARGLEGWSAVAGRNTLLVPCDWYW
jgi:hypothetical protein